MHSVCSIWLAVSSLLGAEGQPLSVTVSLDASLETPLREIAQQFTRSTGIRIDLRPSSQSGQMPPPHIDVSVCLEPDGHTTQQFSTAQRKFIAQTAGHPSRNVVAELHPTAPSARRFWNFLSASTAQAIFGKWNFRVSMQSNAETYDQFVRQRLRFTYPATAMRMLHECGMRDGLCLDIGCGPGQLDIELARRSKLRIIGLDIDPDMIQRAREHVKQAGLSKRITFVVGDVHKMPFEDNSADMIVSRGALPFFEDKARALREVYRVLKPSGVAFLGGRYLYTPRKYLIATEALRQIVRDSGVPGARVIDSRGQWIKIVGPAATTSNQAAPGSPGMAAYRALIDSGIDHGRVLVIGARFPQLTVSLANVSSLTVTQLRLRDRKPAKQPEKVEARQCEERSGPAEALPFPDASFDLVVSVGEVPFFDDKAQVLREVDRVLRPGGYALLGGQYRYMPERMKVSTQQLESIIQQSGLPNVTVDDAHGQWLTIRKPR